MQRKIKIIVIVALLVIITVPIVSFLFLSQPEIGLLDPKTIPKYTNQLVANIPVFEPQNVIDTATGQLIRQDYTIDMTYFREQILPTGTPLIRGSDGKTTVWGYAGQAKDAVTGASLGYFENSPSATFLATQGIPSRVTWVNKIDVPQFLPVDPTIHWANPTGNLKLEMPMTPYPSYPGGFNGEVSSSNPDGLNAQWPVPLVPHLHGGEVQSYYDGGPEAWFTFNGLRGPSYSTDQTAGAASSNAAVYNYPNAQNPTTLWYHDHALGMTRLNVMSGLAGFYLLKNPTSQTITTPTPENFDQYLTQHFEYGVSEIPLAIQDRSFYNNGELWFPTEGENPDIHPYWSPEFFGNSIMVNGKVWPNLDVTQDWYRFRVLDGSNARFYTLSFSNGMPFTVIGTEGGYLQEAAVVSTLTIAPGERYDILVDFSAVPIDSKIILQNVANAPFPDGDPVDPETTGQVMQFTVKSTSSNPGAEAPILPAKLNPSLPGDVFPTLNQNPSQQRILTLTEIEGPNGPERAVINGQNYEGIITETPKAGSEEVWVIINLTGDSHPIHTHLASFQLLSRQPLDSEQYLEDWLELNDEATLPFADSFAPKTLSPTEYVTGPASGPLLTEMGWKDTVQMHPGEITIIRIRFTQQDGTAYPFDATLGPGYVWHCHIVDHEDNEMMRPYKVIP
jgi:FtsP/CotA-like multicopper oxidase with cupredoxin domain